MNNSSSEAEAWRVCEVLNTDEVSSYVRDVTNRMKYDEVNKILSVPSKEDGSIMSASYYLSYKRLSQEAGALDKKFFNLTSEMRNQILAVPPFMTYLYTGLKNKMSDIVR